MKYLGIDYGRKRIGLAISDFTAMISMPFDVIHVRSKRETIDAIREVCEEKEVECIVLGLPLNMDGSRGEMAEEASSFAEALRSAMNVEVLEWDERLSSAFAEKALLENDMSRSYRKTVKDKIAAQSILQSYLDSRQEDFSGQYD